MDKFENRVPNGVKKRSLAGTAGIYFVFGAFILVTVAFATPSWLVSDYRITGAKLDRLGLWTHCFRSLPDPSDIYQRRFFVGCRWIYDPFTTGYDQIKGFLVPGFLVATQFFFTICFLAIMICTIVSLVYFLCCGPDLKQYVTLIQINAGLLLIGGISGALAVIVFAACANRRGWMPGHENNFFGWSFALGCIGVVLMLIASSLFFAEWHVQQKKRQKFKESQLQFEMER